MISVLYVETLLLEIRGIGGTKVELDNVPVDERSNAKVWPAEFESFALDAALGRTVRTPDQTP